ncbi:MAG: hypothetical protein WCF36_05180 [Candidatus Nanopelagicales bacterium]
MSSPHRPPPSGEGPAVGVLALLVVYLLVSLGHRAVAPGLPQAAALAGQIRVDPSVVDRVRVSYLDTSWRDTEGTREDLTGVATWGGHAAAPGAAGHAARAGLARLDQAVALLHAQDPFHGQAVVDHVAAIVAPEVLAAHAPLTHALAGYLPTAQGWRGTPTGVPVSPSQVSGAAPTEVGSGNAEVWGHA